MPSSYRPNTTHPRNEEGGDDQAEERIVYVLTEDSFRNQAVVAFRPGQDASVHRGFASWEYEEIVEQPMLPMIPVTSLLVPCLPPADVAVLSPHTPIKIHDLLAYRLSSALTGPFVHWDVSLRSSTAIISPFYKGEDTTDWVRRPALEPSTSSNMAIRISGVRRPVIVSPARLGSYIRIADIFDTIYDALRASAVSNCRSAQVATPLHGSTTSAHELTANAIRQHLKTRIWWGGLYKGDEQDVWILQTYKTSPGRGWY